MHIIILFYQSSLEYDPEYDLLLLLLGDGGYLFLCGLFVSAGEPTWELLCCFVVVVFIHDRPLFRDVLHCKEHQENLSLSFFSEPPFFELNSRADGVNDEPEFIIRLY